MKERKGKECPTSLLLRALEADENWSGGGVLLDQSMLQEDIGIPAQASRWHPPNTNRSGVVVLEGSGLGKRDGGEKGAIFMQFYAQKRREKRFLSATREQRGIG
ncbi:hypothetical protein BHE74_00034222 [Ensete ventricosum]|nr:hypothetical protein BHE74_00034222 [Ensete ventricosum]